MKKIKINFLIVLVISLLYGKEFLLNDKDILKVKIGDKLILTYTYKDGLNKNTNWVTCNAINDKLKLINKNGSIVKGFKYTFKAVKSGYSSIILTISKVGKGKNKIEKREYSIVIASN